jgi:hypothetical protein
MKFSCHPKNFTSSNHVIERLCEKKWETYYEDSQVRLPVAKLNKQSFDSSNSVRKSTPTGVKKTRKQQESHAFTSERHVLRDQSKFKYMYNLLQYHPNFASASSQSPIEFIFEDAEKGISIHSSRVISLSEQGLQHTAWCNNI